MPDSVDEALKVPDSVDEALEVPDSVDGALEGSAEESSPETPVGQLDPHHDLPSSCWRPSVEDAGEEGMLRAGEDRLWARAEAGVDGRLENLWKQEADALSDAEVSDVDQEAVEREALHLQHRLQMNKPV